MRGFPKKVDNILHTLGKLSLAVPLLALAAPLMASVSVSNPANDSTVTSPVKYSATATTTTCSKGVGSMGVYVDKKLIYVADGVKLSASLPLTAGKHVTVVEEWDRCGGAAFTSMTVTVVASTSSTTAATPKFSLAAGTYTMAQSVTLSDATAGANIYYTTDGSGPTTSSTPYSGAISVDATEVIQAIAVASGYENSGLARADYVIKQASSGPTVPANAISATGLQAHSNWKFNHDPGTTGSSSGEMSMVTDPSLSGEAAKFDTRFSDWGGEIYHLSFGTDSAPQNFVYDAEVWIEEGSQIGNLEMDMNQVIPDGNTVIYGFQCDGDHGTWDYSANTGSLAGSKVSWRHSAAACDPRKWSTDTWHHVQISYSRDTVGHVTYNAVWLDGVEADINATVPSASDAGWAKGDLLTNFQIDGIGSSGSSVVYLDNLTISRW
jgi:Chitobiase/beta-hexosaminidase C-terminal domain